MKKLSRAIVPLALITTILSLVSCSVKNTSSIQEPPLQEKKNTIEYSIFPAQLSYIGEQKWGYIDETGKFVLKPEFTQAGRFNSNGLATAGKGDKVGLIDKTGQFIAAPVYTSISDYNEGLAIAQDDEGFKVLN